MSQRIKRVIVVLAIIIVLFVILRIWVRIYPDWLWFSSQSINLLSVYTTILKTKILLGLGFGLLFLILSVGSFFLVWQLHLKAQFFDAISVGERRIAIGRNIIIIIVLLACLFFSIFLGLSASGQWEPYQRFVKSDGISFSSIDPQNYKDPIFKNDISYYIFKIPFLRFVRGWLFSSFLLITIGTGALYGITSGFVGRRIRLSTAGRAHLFVLFSIILLLLAWGRLFAMYDLLSPANKHGWVYGVGYTDVNARIPVFKIMMITAILSAFLFIISIFVRKLTKISIGAAVLYFIIGILGGGIYPWIVQKFQVDPQEFDKEKKYIGYNISYTRKAYDLDKIEEKPYSGKGELSLQDILENTAIKDNIRLWDWRPLRKTFLQREARRPQYDFEDVDVDRYIVGGKIRQVMLSARELNFSKIKQESQTWVNRTFVYTHGYGLAMIPVSEIESGGLPVMYINDIPPKINHPWDQEIKRPEIYFGEGQKTEFRSEIGKLPYIIVNPGNEVPEEFNYPREPEDVYTTYEGIGGVPINTFWRRLAFALKFSEDTRNILFSGKIKNGSKILFYRSISEMVRVIAPFLKYDKDPYLVVANNRLYWIIDAYTTTHMYPYSEPMVEQITEINRTRKNASPRISYQKTWGNYIRNSVKIVIDAYNGTVTYYSMIKEKGQADPLAECYSRIFPDLFKDFQTMPKELKTHIRYPIALFMIQADKYATYHMKEPKQFYYKEDAWQFSTEKFQVSDEGLATEQPVEPYYVVLQLPDSNKEEFMLMLPFTPFQKKNMIAWLAAKCDIGEDSDLGNYGNLLVYNLPKDVLVDGPIQIEAYIDQHPVMSPQLTLWSQRGSRVIRGNLLAIPIKESILYVEPIYLESDLAQIPELRKVVVAQGGKLDWGDTLEEALANLYGATIPSKEKVQIEQTKTQEKVPEVEATTDLRRKALDHYDQAQKYLRSGNWAKYGEEMEKLKTTLELLQK
ncbi:MAG: UPF0182 family membrane protein [bacterium]